MSARLVTAIVVLTGVAVQANAYELGTHARLTQQAYDRSVMGNTQTGSSLFKDLGIEPKDNPFGDRYYDVFGSDIKERNVADTFEMKHMPAGAAPLSVQGWLMRGAIREDDWTSVNIPFVCNVQAENPQGEENIDRPLHHFFDPVHNRPLTVFGVARGETAPDWATGSVDAFNQPNTARSNRENHFTVFDAREALFRALTGRDRAERAVASTEAERNKYWATTFRALGDVVHLVQDMAQPQHTRNDRHAGVCIEAIAGHKSVYEEYVNARATGGVYALPSGQHVIPSALDYGSYPIPRFTDYASYFSTRHRQGDILKRQGLADYSNRGFFSAGTNLGKSTYPHPEPFPDLYQRRELEVDWLGAPIGGKVTLLEGSVADSLNPGLSASGVPLTTRGLWDEFLEERNLRPSYTLNRYNYDAMADLLVPRAVAYSAGLVDYFFRGRLDTREVNYTDDCISLRLRNAIDPEQIPEWANEVLYRQDGTGRAGRLWIAYTYKEGGQTRYGLSDPVALPRDLRPQEWSEVLAFRFAQPLPVDSGDLKFQLVFRGRLGNEEDAIAVGVVNPAAGFLVQPEYMPADGIGGKRLIYRQYNQWRLSRRTSVQAGNIDWKGWYENGKPTVVLSWMGPSSRYFPETSPGAPSPTFTHYVYQGGEVYAAAPFPVLGAAMNKDAAGREWLVVICRNGPTDMVYRRPNKKSNSMELYDPVYAPEGWRLMGAFPARDGRLEPDTPWFFNGSGTEAQTMRRAKRRPQAQLSQVVADPQQVGGNEFSFIAYEPPEAAFLDRLKITIVGESASIENLGNSHMVTQTDVLKGASGLAYTQTKAGSYVVAVDYLDSQEVLARLEVAKAEKDEYVSQSAHSRSHRYTTTNVSRLSFGTESVELRNIEFDLVFQQTADATFTGRLNQGHVSITAIHYADLRHGVLLFEKRDKSFSQPCGSSYLLYPNPSPWECIEYAGTDRMVLRAAGWPDHVVRQEQRAPVNAGLSEFSIGAWTTPVLIERFPDGPVGTWVGRWRAVWTDEYIGAGIGPREVWVPLYAYFSGEPSQDPLEPLIVGSTNAPDRLHPITPFTGSIGVDSVGNAFASVNYRDSSGRSGNFSFLAGADPKQVIPLAPGDVGYTFVCVVK